MTGGTISAMASGKMKWLTPVKMNIDAAAARPERPTAQFPRSIRNVAETNAKEKTRTIKGAMSLSLERTPRRRGALCIFHGSLVPPVKQAGGDLYRYHEFLERGWPFTRTFGATGVDGVALPTEHGIIASLGAMAYWLIGLLQGQRESSRM